jgi:chromate transporter
MLQPREDGICGPGAVPSFAEAFRFWLRLGAISVGDPAGQITILHRQRVDQ